MARLETWYKQDLKRPLIVHKHTDVFNQDSKGNLIGVEVYSDGEPVVLSGSISGYCLLADGTTVPAVGASRSGNKASVLIPQTAYGVPGPITITIKNVEGDNITTLCATVGIVRQSVSGNLVNPGSVVTDWSNNINAQLQAVQTAVDNVGAIVAAPFDENTVYVVGNYVTNNGNLYRITAYHAAGVAWANTAKVQCTVGHELEALNNHFIANRNLIDPEAASSGKTDFIPVELNVRYNIIHAQSKGQFQYGLSLYDSNKEMLYIGQLVDEATDGTNYFYSCQFSQSAIAYVKIKINSAPSGIDTTDFSKVFFGKGSEYIEFDDYNVIDAIKKVKDNASDIVNLKSALKKSNYKTLADKDSTSVQRITTTGIPTASGSWTTYWFENDGIYDITCTVASSGTGDNAISFFNSDIPSSSSYIGGVAIKNGTHTYYNVLVPSNCKLIAISNRTDSYATPSAILSANMAGVAFNKLLELETDLNTVRESVPDVRYSATDVDCDFTQSVYITALTGVPHNSGSWKSYFFKNKGFTSVDCTVFLGSGDAAIAFYNDEIASADAFISAVVSTVNNGTRSYTATVPTGCKLIAVCNRYASLANPVVKLYMPMDSVYDKVFELEDEVDALSGKTDIISVNEDIAYIVSSSSAKIGVDYNKIRHKYFSVLHGSDFHKDATNFQRMMEYAYKNPSNVDCVFATGDFKDHWAESDDGFLMTYGAYYQSAGVPVLPIIGNHETGYSPAVESVGGVVNTIANIDAKFITPYMTYNGCVQGSGGYYYRDFSDYKVRVIALNEYEMPRVVDPNDSTKYLYDYWYRYLSQTQITWLCSTLGSVPEGYHVIVIMHMMPDKITEYTDNKFNSPNVIVSDVYASAQGSVVQDIIDAYIGKTTLSQTYANTIGAPSTDVPDVTVNADFTSANGEFVAYIVGHTHYDKVGKSSVAENTQTVVVVTTSGTTKAYYDDIWREEGTKSQDCFNYLVFDTDAKKIRIVRVGANTTLNMDWRDMTSISYT